MHATDIWEGRSLGPRLIRLALIPASVVYALGWRAYRLMYAAGVKRPKTPHCPVVCVGNLTVGGSGKTPVTLLIARELLGSGRQVVISCSGYRSPASEAAKLAPDGSLKASQWGDEPALIRWKLPDVPLIVGRDRVLAAQICHLNHPGAVLLMDDGFQHLPLTKHLSILLESGGRNRWCLPAGPFREPASFRRLADLVLPGAFSLADRPIIVMDARGAEQAPTKVNALCALAQPGKFFHSLANASFEIAHQRALPDHDSLLAGNLFEGWSRETPVVVTAKDWVKLRDREDIGDRTIWVADHEVEIEPRNDFVEWIDHKLNELSEQP